MTGKKRPRRTALMKQAGPYSVSSRADGTLVVTPEWPNVPECVQADGGGPGVIERLELAADIEAFLNGEKPK